MTGIAGALWTPRNKFMGLVGTRGALCTNLGNTATYMSRTFSYARTTISAIKIAFGNFYVPWGGGTETTVAATTAIRASVEYPAGTFHQILWEGAALGTIPASGIGFSDLTPVDIPQGAIFYIRMQVQNNTGIVCIDPTSGPACYPTGGDALESTTTNLTLSGTVVDGFSGDISIPPLAILGWTNQPSVLMIGDSRTFGFGDVTLDTTGDRGNLARPLGGSYAYITMGVPGDTASNFVSSHTLRAQIGKYATHVISAYGINDFYTNHSTPATVEAFVGDMAGYLLPRQFLQCTLEPESTSSNSWETLAGQTVGAANTSVQTFNTWVRGNGNPMMGLLDIASALESGGASAPSGKWIVNGTANFYTADGIHGTTAAEKLLMLANGGPIAPLSLSQGGFGWMPRT